MGMTRDKMEFVASLAKAMPDASAYHITSVAQRLLRLAATHQRIAVDQCNGPDYSRVDCANRTAVNEVSKHWQEYQDTLPLKQGSIRQRIVALITAEVHGAKVHFQGDPRGWTVKLLLNGREVGIPTS